MNCELFTKKFQNANLISISIYFERKSNLPRNSMSKQLSI